MIIKPTFYDDFKCIAGACSITCCQEWKITNDDGSIIPLDQNMRCPYLTGEKLCQLVIEHGDSALSETCTLFPRQVHEFENRVEYSLVTCCPEVVDFLEKADCFDLTETIKGNSLFSLRQFLMDLLAKEEYSIEMALKMGFYILQDVKSIGHFDVNNYKEEALEELEEAIRELETDFMDSFMECNETFLDLAENYRKQGIYKSFLGWRAELAEAYEEDFDEDELIEQYEAFLEAFEEYQSLIRKCLISNVFSDLLLPESDINNMLVAFQWLGMEYASLRQALFLTYKKTASLEYETVRETIVYMSRMTGYDEEDIVEYLNNCFEELEWEWGYFALLIGG